MQTKKTAPNTARKCAQIARNPGRTIHVIRSDASCGCRRPRKFRGASGVCAKSPAADLAGHAQFRRRRRQSGADAEGDRSLSRQESEAGLQDQLHQGAGARTAGQDQGAAGRQPRRHRRRADRHRRAVGRRRPEALDPDRIRICREAAEARRHLSAGRQADAGPRGKPGRLRRVLPGRPGDRIHARQGEAGADDGRGAAGLGQGQSQPLHLCPPGQFRSRPHLHDGPALHPRRQGSEGSDEWLGQDLGLSQGARPIHRILSRRHRRR